MRYRDLNPRLEEKEAANLVTALRVSFGYLMLAPKHALFDRSAKPENVRQRTELGARLGLTSCLGWQWWMEKV
jgi:hypothetical protein